ncbi:MAG: YgjV family protein [Ruminococcaceae bacterium]|nr:YgjV family protein [Oscillospiraceae bacterium]
MDKALYIIGQAVGIVAIIIGIVTYQIKSRRGIMIANIASTICFALHYAMIGAYVGMALNIVATVRNVVFYNSNMSKKKSTICTVTFAVIACVAGIITWEAWYSVLQLMNSVVRCYVLSLSNPNSIRKGIMIVVPMTLIYNIIVFSIGGIISDSCSLISTGISLFRYREKPIKKQKA